MSIADKITLSRVFLAPLFFLLYRYPLLEALPTVILLWLLFAVIELSDLVDGKIARSSSTVSDFGKLFDPFADVLARVSYFICFAFDGIMPLWIFLIILYREFSILFLRMMLSGRGIAMGARPGGKLKAGLYMVSGLFALRTPASKAILAAPLQNPLKSWWSSYVVAGRSFRPLLRGLLDPV
jgi:CDP-diacylglycerol--glycerol-3-phosphate 3-phosphatidyltransferase